MSRFCFLRLVKTGIATISPKVASSSMNRRVMRQILIALAIFAGIILVFALIAQVA